MPDSFHDFPVRAAPARVFAAMTSPAGLDRWWTLRSAGTPRLGTDYVLDFGPEYVWRARVSRCVPDREFEWEFTEADPEWLGTKAGFQLTGTDGRTQVRFHHSG